MSTESDDYEKQLYQGLVFTAAEVLTFYFTLLLTDCSDRDVESHSMKNMCDYKEIPLKMKASTTKHMFYSNYGVTAKCLNEFENTEMIENIAKLKDLFIKEEVNAIVEDTEIVSFKIVLELMDKLDVSKVRAEITKKIDMGDIDASGIRSCKYMQVQEKIIEAARDSFRKQVEEFPVYTEFLKKKAAVLAGNAKVEKLINEETLKKEATAEQTETTKKEESHMLYYVGACICCCCCFLVFLLFVFMGRGDSGGNLF